MKIPTPDDDESQASQAPQDPGPSFRFTKRWQRKRAQRSSRAMWATMGLDLALLVMIILMVWVAFRAWD